MAFFSPVELHPRDSHSFYYTHNFYYIHNHIEVRIPQRWCPHMYMLYENLKRCL